MIIEKIKQGLAEPAIFIPAKGENSLTKLLNEKAGIPLHGVPALFISGFLSVQKVSFSFSFF